MGVFDWLQRLNNPANSSPQDIREARDAVEGQASARGIGAPGLIGRWPSIANTNARGDKGNDARWLPAGESVRIQGYDIPGGMIYLGHRLNNSWGVSDPSLIDPDLKADIRHVNPNKYYYNQWMSYANQPKDTRARYLEWLAGGRRDPRANISDVRLFLCGIERRVFVDIAGNQRLASELPGIREEVMALRDRYFSRNRAHTYFLGTISDFIAILDYLLAGSDPAVGAPAPVPTTAEFAYTYHIPLSLHIGLGRIAAARQPLPADWAFAWRWYSPEFTLSTPAQRCGKKFRQLFALRYREAFGDGMIIRRGKTTVQISYYSSNPSIGQVSWDTGTIPRVFHLKGQLRKLDAVFAAVSLELDKYSRYLGRFPHDGEKLAGVALLPPELLRTTSGEVGQLRNWAREQVGATGKAEISSQDLLRLWSKPEDGSFTKTEALQAAGLLAHLGFGIEPDVRSSGSVISGSKPLVLFKRDTAAEPEPSARYGTSTLIVHMAALVMQTDGRISWQELGGLGDYLGSAFNLGSEERTRLHAHILWLSTVELKLNGLKRRAEKLAEEQRASIGDLLVAIAAIDGTISPAEIRMLEKLFRVLELDPKTVTSRIHASMTGELGHVHTGPVTVRKEQPAEPGLRIPARPAGTATSAAQFTLDAKAIKRKMSETAAVSALLGDLFQEQEDEPAVTAPVAAPSPQSNGSPKPGKLDGKLIAGLDVPHSELLRALGERPEWTRAEFVEMASALHLMPDGAIDMLNEAAFEVAEEPLLEGDESLIMNTYALEVLTR